MPSYDEDSPTVEENILLKQLVDQSTDKQQRIATIIHVKNLVIGSKRCKTTFSRAGIVEIFYNLLQEFSSSQDNNAIVIEILDCLSSLAKSDDKTISKRLIELGCIEHLFTLFTARLDSIEFCESSLRCLRSFFLPNFSQMDYSNPFLTPIPFVLLCEQEARKPLSLLSQEPTLVPTSQLPPSEQHSSIEILFTHPQYLDLLIRLLPTSKTAQLSIIEILCSLCINNERQNQLVDKQIIPPMIDLLVQNINANMKSNLVSLTDEYIVGLCLKFFCSLCYENPSIAQQLSQINSSETNQNLCDIIVNFLIRTNRSVIINYYASKFFVNLCKTKVLPADHRSVSLHALTTLIHLSSKSNINKSIYLYIECLQTLIYLLNGNSSLHPLAMYTEQFLSKLFVYVFTPNKILDITVDELLLVQIRASALTLLAVLSSHHDDIQKRIAEQDNLIPTAIECYRSTHILLQLAALRLFHGLSRSVHQLRTTFNDTICDILLEAIQSTDIAIVKISSCVISNFVLEFSTCRTRLLNGGILDTLLAFLKHPDHDLCINSIWALRNLSYLAKLDIKQDIINGLTIDRIYSLLEQCTDEQFLICLLSLLRNLFHENVTSILPIFNATKLTTTLQGLLERITREEIRQEVNILLRDISSSNQPLQQQQSRSSADSINPSCRTSLLPDYACDEMDQLDCS